MEGLTGSVVACCALPLSASCTHGVNKAREVLLEAMPQDCRVLNFFFPKLVAQTRARQIAWGNEGSQRGADSDEDS
eukprot:1152238-Pelagomonas_calceolata.AAC.1